jgi:hypothetical protein
MQQRVYMPAQVSILDRALEHHRASVSISSLVLMADHCIEWFTFEQLVFHCGGNSTLASQVAAHSDTVKRLDSLTGLAIYGLWNIAGTFLMEH